MGHEEDLKKELKILREKREGDTRVKNLKKQIKAEKFSQTRGGKVFNKIADIGDAGFKATGKFLSPRKQQAKSKSSSKKKKKTPARVSVEQMMAKLPQ